MIGSTVASLPKFARRRRTRASRFSLEFIRAADLARLFEAFRKSKKVLAAADYRGLVRP